MEPAERFTSLDGVERVVPDVEPDESDTFGVHEKWSEQSMELARWIWPAFLIVFGVTGATKFGLGFDPDVPWAFGILGACCLVFVAGVVLYTLAGGPMRVEVDQALKTVKWIHARRLRPREQCWHFDEISQFFSQLSTQHFRRYIDDTDTDRLPHDIETYYVVMELTNGTRQLLFGKGFKESSRSSRCDTRLAKMVKLTGRPLRPAPSREEFEAMNSRVDVALSRRH